MYYLLEQDVMTGKWETNMTIYGMTPEEVMNKVCPDGFYMQEHSFVYGAPCAIMYRIMHPRDSFLDKFVGIIYSIG